MRGTVLVLRRQVGTQRSKVVVAPPRAGACGEAVSDHLTEMFRGEVTDMLRLTICGVMGSGGVVEGITPSIGETKGETPCEVPNYKKG